MHAFQDNAGRTWEVAINVAAVRRLRGILKIDLMKVVADAAKGIGELLSDPVTLVDMIFVLCQEQAEKKGITDEDFGRAMAGDVIGKATDAFLEELVDFFPEEKARANLRKLLTKAKEVGNLILQQTERQVETLNPQSIADRWIKSSTNAPESLDSTPALSPSANSAA